MSNKIIHSKRVNTLLTAVLALIFIPGDELAPALHEFVFHRSGHEIPHEHNPNSLHYIIKHLSRKNENPVYVPELKKAVKVLFVILHTKPFQPSENEFFQEVGKLKKTRPPEIFRTNFVIRDLFLPRGPPLPA